MKKTIVITGTSSGIGSALALRCVRQGYHVVNICRKSAKSEAFYQELLKENYAIKPEMIYADLSRKEDIESAVKDMGEKLDRIDLLINNAGVLKLKQEYSQEGIEMTMAVNLLAAFRLTEGLLERFEGFDVINITSELFKKGQIDLDQLKECKIYKGANRYNDSKKALLYYSAYLSDRLNGRARVIAMHPGVVASNAFRDYPKLIVKMFNLVLENPDKAASKILEPYMDGNMKHAYYYSQNQKKEKLKSYVDQSHLEALMEKLNREYR